VIRARASRSPTRASASGPSSTGLPEALLIESILNPNIGLFTRINPAAIEISISIGTGVGAVCGGRIGKLIELRAGDVAVLPAGTGHQRVFGSPDLLVVGAYPPGGHYDECRGSHKQRERARASIPQVPLPDKDPVYGAEGPLLDPWR
jgi:uncharacterized protein YjlB